MSADDVRYSTAEHWMMAGKARLKDYKHQEAPTVLLKLYGQTPHTLTHKLQGERARLRELSGKVEWSGTITEELPFMVDDFKVANSSDEAIRQILEQQYKMLR